MLLQIAADARQIQRDRDAHCPQMLGRTDAGQHQQARAVHRTGRQHDAVPRMDLPQLARRSVFDADRAPALEQQALHRGFEPHLEIGRHAGQFEIAGRRAAQAVALGPSCARSVPSAGFWPL